MGIERKLANHILETFTDVLDIDWQEVAGMLDFQGNTVNGLKKIFMGKMRWNVSQRLGLASSREVSLQQVADYANQTVAYGDGKTTVSEKVSKRQRNIIDYFLAKAEERGVENFL